MPTVTIKNLPDDLYARLKAAAKAHHRSINGEIIHCLESALMPRRIDTMERLERLRRIRVRIPPEAITPEALEEAIDEGRP